MANHPIDASELGHALALEELRLPDDVAAGLGRLYGGDPPATAAAWVAMLRDHKRAVDGDVPTVEDLCTTDDGAHAFVSDDRTESFVCVLDPLAVPFLTDTAGTIRSTTPEREQTIEITVGPDGIDYTHPDAVVSVGVDDDVDCEACATIDDTYEQVCPYIHVFEDESEYESWAETTDAATTPLPVETGVALAGALAAELFGPAN